MANTKSTEKRIRQSEKSRKHNVEIKSSLRTAAKKVLKKISASSNPEETKENFRQFAKGIDTAVRKGVVHKKTAARKNPGWQKKLIRQLKKAVNQVIFLTFLDSGINIKFNSEKYRKKDRFYK